MTLGVVADKLVQIDAFTNPKDQRTSQCYRINYRSMDK